MSRPDVSRSVISSDSIVAASRDQVSCSIQGEAAILSLADGLYYGLDPVGARIWGLLQTPTRVSAILETLLDEYDVDAARCEADLMALLERLGAARLVVVDGRAS